MSRSRPRRPRSGWSSGKSWPRKSSGSRTSRSGGRRSGRPSSAGRRKDPEFVALWKETREWSLADFRRIFDELGAHFDVWFFESEVEEAGREIVRELLQKGIAEIGEGGVTVVKIDEKLGLKNETYRTMPILRSDGTTLYSTKDLALTRRKFEDLHIDRAIWVVDVRQSLYFEQIFKILELWGFEQAKNAHHLGYEMVVLPEGVISSRKGNAPVYDDVRDAVLARAREIIDEKNPEMPAEDAGAKVAKQVGHRLAQVRDAGAGQQQDGHIRHRGGALLRWSRGALYPVRACPGLPDPREREGAVGGGPSSRSCSRRS